MARHDGATALTADFVLPDQQQARRDQDCTHATHATHATHHARTHARTHVRTHTHTTPRFGRMTTPRNARRRESSFLLFSNLSNFSPTPLFLLTLFTSTLSTSRLPAPALLPAAPSRTHALLHASQATHATTSSFQYHVMVQIQPQPQPQPQPDIGMPPPSRRRAAGEPQ